MTRTSSPPVAQAGRGWWRILVLFTIAAFSESLFWGQLTSFTPLYLPHLGIAPADVALWIGVIGVISSTVGIPFLPLWGALADRYARQPVIVRSFVAHMLAGVLAMTAGNVWVFVLARSMGSFALGNSGLMMTTLSEQAPHNRIGLAFGVMNGASPLGAVLGPLIGGLIVDRYGFPALMGLGAIAMLGVVLALTFGYHDNYRGTDRGPLLQMAWASVAIIWGSPRLRIIFPAYFLLFAGRMLAFTYVAVAVDLFYTGSQPGTAVGLVVGASGLTTLVFSPAFGALADRFGHWRVLFAGAGALVLLWPLPFFASDLLTFGLAWALVSGLGAGVFAISFSVLSDSAAPAVRGRVMTFAYLPFNIGAVLGALLGTIVAQDNVLVVFPTAAVLTAAGLLVLAYAARQPVTVTAAPPISETAAPGL